MPIRVMHVLNNLGKGGLENGLVNLIAGLDPSAYEHVVCTVRGLGPNVDRLPKDRVHVMEPMAAGSDSRVQLPALMRAIRQFRPHVVHSRNWSGIEAVVAARLVGGCGVVHSEHGFEAAAGAEEPRRRIYFRRLAYQLAHRVLSVSHQLRDYHAQRTGFPASRIGVVHNGVDRNRFSPDAEARARVRRELGLGDDDFCIGCVANLLPVKDHMTLVRALPAMERGPGDWRLLLIGDGQERPRLEAAVAANEAWKGRVAFLGASGRVAELLRAMDAFVLPSVAEGINNSVLEAMATGVPVVATAVGGNPEVVVHEETGLLFASGDDAALGSHLTRLRADRGFRSQLGRAAIRRVAEQFSLESMVRAYHDVYASVLPAQRTPALTGS